MMKKKRRVKDDFTGEKRKALHDALDLLFDNRATIVIAGRLESGAIVHLAIGDKRKMRAIAKFLYEMWKPEYSPGG